MGKKTALVVNQTSLIGDIHLADSLLSCGIFISRIFAPEHGFRGEADAGEKVKDGCDIRTGLPIISLYGKNKKPSAEQMSQLDRVVFDIQDVGARFYTYISTLHYVMEACAEHGVPLLILDRPNPNGFYIDGPVLDSKFASFVGMHPIPIVHGLTIGELACMINEEGWLSQAKNCNIEVISCLGYTHRQHYRLPVRPSPNLPDMRAVYLYPSLCFFEGTNVSVGRGTDFPFTIIGEPAHHYKNFSFTPVSKPGAKNPPHLDVLCYGKDLRDISIDSLQKTESINWSWLVEMYKESNNKNDFFLPNKFIDKLVGTDELRKAILSGEDLQKLIRKWNAKVSDYKIMRKKYLLYPDFE